MIDNVKPMRLIRKILLFCLSLAVSGILILFFLIIYYSRSLPSIEEIQSRQISQSTKIYDRTGTILLYEISNGQERTVVPLNAIPQYLKDATVAIEDERFYEEPAFDWRGIIRAFIANLARGKITQGASTITQQLARNAFLTPEQTISRKIKELVLAVELDRHYSKDKILELYLNEIPYGSTAYGVESASETFFGKPAAELNLAECALLAAIPKAPTYYSPWGNHLKDLIARQHLVLNKMSTLGKISKKELTSALNYQLTFQPQGSGIKAPHFVMDVEDYLIQKYGEDTVRTGGLKVITTLDWGLEQLAEKVVKEGAEQNEKLYGGYNSALVAQDAKTGQVLALVGSRNYLATTSLPTGCTAGASCKFEPNFDVATQGLRQPGSALKPFVYYTAFTRGYTPDAVVFDVPTEFRANDPNCPAIPDYTNDNPECFHPENFDEQFRGPVSFKQALAQSINVPSVKVLYLAGLRNVIENANNFGLTTLTSPDLYGLSLVLGGGAVKLSDLVEAYSVLAEDGVKHKQTVILEVYDGSGNVLENYNDRASQVANIQPVRLVNSILSDPNLRSGLFQNSLSLTVFPNHDVALKTGTSNDYHDAWAIGYTPSLVVGVWSGNNDNTAMQRHGSSILAAVPIWHNFMAEALKDRPLETFNKPDAAVPQKPILAGNYLLNNQIHSILYYVDRNNPAGPPPDNPSTDPQFTNWETEVLNWAQANIPNLQASNQTSSTTISSQSPQIAYSNTPPSIQIKTPASGSYISGQVYVQTKIISTSDIIRIRVFFNDQIIQEFNGNLGSNYDFGWAFTPSNPQAQNLLEVEATNQNGLTNKDGVIIYK